MRDSEPQSGLNFNFIVPIAMLVVLLLVPFSFNALMHMLMSKKHVNPVIMKLPVDSTAITIPPAVKQYESFEVTLNLETKHLAKFVNELVATASEGTGIQGISGVVSPDMKAEIAGDGFVVGFLEAGEVSFELVLGGREAGLFAQFGGVVQLVGGGEHFAATRVVVA